MRSVIAVGGLLLLAGCSSHGAGSDQWTHWVCDSDTEVLWRFVDDGREQVDLRLNGSDIVHRLQRQPSGSGALYTDGNLAFHTKGREALVYWAATDDLIGSDCKAP